MNARPGHIQPLAGPRPPRGLARLAFRLPLPLYRHGLGWLMTNNFLLLTHTGRQSHAPRRTVLEVIAHDAVSDIYYVASIWSPPPDWVRNLNASPDAQITVGRREMNVVAYHLTADAAEQLLMNYVWNHPLRAKMLPRLLGQKDVRHVEDFRAMARQMTIFALCPESRAANEGR
ncbi:MAG TPA: nitroreductase family deazaflavin-dependent oxidoreductase [Thermomicrobiales bacterium]|nr:nitroreductase family deazaflavin-dependent oxidoreductase [Thermomicrobiales bacterium]